VGADGGNSEPTLPHSPKPLGVAEMGEKKHHCLLILLAKQKNTTVIPSPPLWTIRHLNSILESQPSKELDIWMSQNLQYQLVQICYRGSQELCVVRRGRRVFPIRSEVANDAVFGILN
jgi:hypothetical protein